MATQHSKTNSDDLALELYDKLKGDNEVEFPNIDLNDPMYNFGDTTTNPLYASVTKLTLDELTTRQPCGAGVFDALMEAYSKHIEIEYDKGRITGTEYAKAYVDLTSNAMSQSIQFLMSKDQAYWSALLVQAQGKAAEIAAIQALVELARLKVDLTTASINVDKVKAETALTKLQLSSEDARIDLVRTQDEIEEYRLATHMPLETQRMQEDISMLGVQRITMGIEQDKARYELSTLMPDTHLLNLNQIEYSLKQAEHMTAQIDAIQFDIQQMKPAQLLQISAETSQIEAVTGKHEYELTTLMPDQHSLTIQQIAKSTKEVEMLTFDMEFVKPVELAGITAQTALTEAKSQQAAYEIATLMPDAHQKNLKELELADNEILKTSKDIEMQDYQIANMLPKSLEKITAEITQITAQNAKISAERDNVVYSTSYMLPSQRENVIADTQAKTYTASNVLPTQVANTEADTLIKEYTRLQILPVQRTFTQEQMEAKRAETLNSRTDGQSVTGSIGKQKDLYTQQIDSYKRDAEYKVGRMLIDTWITRKGIDEATPLPVQIDTASIDGVVTKLKANNGLT